MKTALLSLAACGLALQGAGPSRPPITGLAWAAFSVSSAENAAGFYGEFLGYERLPSAGGLVFKVNDRQYLEFELSPRAPAEDRIRRYAFETRDAEGLRRYLAARGIATPARLETSPLGYRYFYVKDPDGHAIGFLEYLPKGQLARARGKHLSAARLSERLLHTGILVGSLDASMRFYRDVLGFRELWRGSANDETLSWVNMAVPDGGDYIEFMLYRDMPAEAKRGSQHHICLETPDLKVALARAEASPWRKNHARPIEARVGRNRRNLSNLFDPDGTRTELMEPGTVDGKPAPSSTAPAPR